MHTETPVPVRFGFRGMALAVGLMAFAGPAVAEPLYVVQIAAVKSEARANEEWSRLKSNHTELLGDMNLILRQVDLGDRGVFFRMQTGPFPNRLMAIDMCQQLKAVDMECIVAERP